MAAAEVKKAIVKNMENSSITFEEAKKGHGCGFCWWNVPLVR